MDTIPQRQRMYCDVEHIHEIKKFIEVLVKCELKLVMLSREINF